MSILKVAIEVTNNAFLPEAVAYNKFFLKNKVSSEILYKGDPEILNFDAVILFHGFHPFWKKYPPIVISEYHSLSTGLFSRIKDLIKRVVNIKGSSYVFLNEEVRKKLFFSKDLFYSLRPMGFDSEIYNQYKNIQKKYDLVYSGSYREGLKEYLLKLANLNLSIAVVGIEPGLLNHKNIFFLGRVSPEESSLIICQSTYGLNYTPDVFPLNVQDSTKIIEYCAADLKIITNKYEWINSFEKQRSANFLDLNSISTIEDISRFDFITPNIDDLSWDNVLKNNRVIMDLISRFSSIN